MMPKRNFALLTQLSVLLCLTVTAGCARSGRSVEKKYSETKMLMGTIIKLDVCGDGQKDPNIKRAYDSVCPLVISMWCGNGRVIDKDGTILASGHMFRDWRGIIPDQIVAAEVDPTAPRVFAGYESYQSGLLAERQTTAYQPLTRAHDDGSARTRGGK